MVATRAYLLETDSIIEPLGDAARDAPVLNRPLHEHTERVCKAAGLEGLQHIGGLADLPADGPCVVIPDDVFLTEHTLRAFLEAAEARKESVQLGIADSRFLTDSRPLQTGIEPPGGDPSAATFGVARLTDRSADTLEQLPSVLVDLEVVEKTLDDLPRVFRGDEEVAVPWTSRPVMRMSHWVHVVRANQYALMALAAGYRERSKVQNWLSILGLLIKSFPPTESRIARALVRKGKGCKIHPTAVVEASILGDGVQVGPHAIVRACVLADRAVVQPHAHAEMSCFGTGAVISKQTWANFVVLFPGAVLAAHAQMSVFGRDSFVATYSPLQDLALEGDVKVQCRGEITSVGSRFMGVCIGHDTRVGGGVFVAHGRAVPNGRVVVKNPADVLRKVEDGEGVLVVADGVARPLEGGARGGE